MFLSLLTLVTALIISAVAIYYSVAGLAAIFAAAVIPIIIMGTTLEVAKLVTTVWLHRYWTTAVWWLKSYLTVAVVVLMFITSMGIFGFLSKAHIDQTTSSNESVAQVERMKTEITRQTELIERSEQRIKQIETGGVGGQSNIQNQITQEQQRIDSAYSRVQPAIDEQQKIIDDQTTLFQRQITNIDEQIARLQQLIDAKDIVGAQALVGTRPDGNWGPATARSVESWKQSKLAERNTAISKLEQTNNNPVIISARNEIQRIRQGVETQIADSNRLINRLRDQLGNTDTDEVEKLIAEQRERITVAQSEIDKLTEQRYKLEGEYRKLVAEVGPVKYIAEFIYGNQADKNMLEEAVRWVIVIIIFVFDPLAVLLLLASQYSFEEYRRTKKKVVQDQENGQVSEPVDPVIETVEPVSTDSVDKLFKPESYKSIVAWNIPAVLKTPVASAKVPATEKIKKTKITKPKKQIVETIDEPIVETIPTIDSPPRVEIEQKEIITGGVTKESSTYFHPDEKYVQYEGKLMSIDALREQHPELVLPKSSPMNVILFGSEFPSSAKTGDIYIRVDVIPHRVYKFNGTKWINLDKNSNTTYLQNESYIQYLIAKIDTKEYDVDFLTDFERDEITEYFKSK